MVTRIRGGVRNMKESVLKKEAASIWKDKKVAIAIIAVMAIPILYAGMFLWAFWDPYDYIEALPIAVVNEDEGADFEDEHLDLGDELISKLKEEETFDFHFVDKETGYTGLQNEEYYVLIEIPTDFSKHATTVLDETPEQMNLLYVPNESFNFLAAQMGETAMLEIEAALEEKVIETYADTMFDSVHELADGLKTAHDGSSELHDGTKELDDGVHELQDGSTELEDGTIQLFDGIGTLAGKSSELASGIDEVSSGAGTLTDGLADANSGLGQLVEGQHTLADGATELKNGADDLAVNLGDLNEGLTAATTGIDEVIDGTTGIENGALELAASLAEFNAMAESAGDTAADINEDIAHLEQELQPLLEEAPEDVRETVEAGFERLLQRSETVAEGSTNIQSGIFAVSDGADKLASNINTLAASQRDVRTGLGTIQEGGAALENGAQTLLAGHTDLTEGMNYFAEQLTTAQSGVSQLADGSQTLSSGLGELSNGAGAFVEGSSELSSGAEDVSTGMGTLHEGIVTLADGTLELTDGSGELAEKLGEAADEASITTSDKNAEMMSNPVKVDQEGMNEVPNYGTGFAPYFLSLGLFVGALLLSIVYPLRTPAGEPKNAFQWFMSKSVMLVGIGIIQALIACGILIWALGLEVQSVPLFLTFAILTSITFITLIQFFVTSFDNPGRFIAILILIFQLTTSAGTFPLELIPESLQAINAFLPMTYSVHGFKAVISSGDFSVMWQNAGILLGFTAVFVAGTITYFAIQLRKGKNTLVEEAA